MNNYSLFKGEIKTYKKFSLLSLLMIAVSIAAYEPYGPHTSDKWQIQAYSNAAPSFIGNNAAMIEASGNVISASSIGWTCLS